MTVNKTKQNGFTLLEMVISITVLIILLAAMQGVLVSTLQARKKLDEIANKSRIGPVLLKMIADEIGNAFSDPNLKDPFIGKNATLALDESDRVDFITSRDHWDIKREIFTPISEISFYLEPNEDNPSFYKLMERISTDVDEDITRGGWIFELYDRVIGFNLEYYDGKEWTNDWDGEKKSSLPIAVRVKLTLGISEEAIEEGIEENQTIEYSTIVLLYRFKIIEEREQKKE